MRPYPASQSGVVIRRSDPGPLNADWGWAPSDWRGADGKAGALVAESVRLFHDAGSQADLDVSALDHGVKIAVRGFDGNFVSLAIDLPRDATDGLRTSHMLSALTEVNHAGFLRLNLQRGDDVLVRLTAVGPGPGWASIDLDRMFPDLARFEKGWLDLIVERPRSGELILAVEDIRRHPRPAM